MKADAEASRAEARPAPPAPVCCLAWACAGSVDQRQANAGPTLNAGSPGGIGLGLGADLARPPTAVGGGPHRHGVGDGGRAGPAPAGPTECRILIGWRREAAEAAGGWRPGRANFAAFADQQRAGLRSVPELRGGAGNPARRRTARRGTALFRSPGSSCRSPRSMVPPASTEKRCGAARSSSLRIFTRPARARIGAAPRRPPPPPALDPAPAAEPGRLCRRIPPPVAQPAPRAAQPARPPSRGLRPAADKPFFPTTARTAPTLAATYAVLLWLRPVPWSDLLRGAWGTEYRIRPDTIPCDCGAAAWSPRRLGFAGAAAPSCCGRPWSR